MGEEDTIQSRDNKGMKFKANPASELMISRQLA